jgi:hypothetical protein
MLKSFCRACFSSLPDTLQPVKGQRKRGISPSHVRFCVQGRETTDWPSFYSGRHCPKLALIELTRGRSSKMLSDK